MVQYDAVSAWSVVFAGAAGAVLVALVANALLAGGALEVLVGVRDDASGGRGTRRPPVHAPLLPRRGSLLLAKPGPAPAQRRRRAGRAGRSERRLRSALAAASTTPCRWRPAGPAWSCPCWCSADRGVLLGGTRLRPHPARAHDARGVFRTWWRGFRLVLRRLPAALGLWLAVALLVGLAAGALLAWHWAVTFHTWALILLTAAAQQILPARRAWLRTVQLAGEIELAARAEPLAIEPVRSRPRWPKCRPRSRLGTRTPWDNVSMLSTMASLRLALAVVAISAGPLAAQPAADPMELVKEGRRLNSAGKQDEALALYAKALASDPTCSTPTSLLASRWTSRATTGRPANTSRRRIDLAPADARVQALSAMGVSYAFEAKAARPPSSTSASSTCR